MKRKTSYILFGFTLIVLSFVACKDEDSSEKVKLSSKEKIFINKVDSITQVVMDSLRISSGMAISVVKGNKVLLSKGYGVSDIVTNEPVTKETMFYIASTTKSFVGLLSSILHEKNIFSLNTTLEESFPNVKFNDSINSDKVTMRHLLSHTSGVNNGPLTYRLAYSGQINDSIESALVKYCIPNDKKLGEYMYDNTGYNLYTIALKAKTRINWKDALKQYVFDPLNMDNTSAYISNIERKSLKLAKPYTTIVTDNIDSVLSISLRKTDATMQSAGGLITNSKNLANWLLANLNDGKLGVEQKITSSAIELSQKAITSSGFSKEYNQPKSYALGWELIGQVQDSTDLIYHYGGYSGYSTTIILSHKQKIGVSFITNSTFGHTATKIIKQYIFNYFKNANKAEEDFRLGIKNVYKEKKQLYEHFKRDRDNRKGRKWKVNFKNDFNGTFSNEVYGTINVMQKDSTLLFEYGNMKSVAQPYVVENSVRVEFIPLSGDIILFDIDKEEIIKGLTYKRRYFKKH